jgi:adenosylcobinamide-GDP ribazoletransferase
MTAAPPTVCPRPSPASFRERLACSTRSWTQAPVFALQFLTIVPPVVRRAPRADDLGRSESFFPMIGLLLGASVAAADHLLAPVVPPLVRDVVAVSLLAILTGALHLDGVVDTFDGLFMGTSPARRLEIMRDPRAGSYGVVAVTLLLALKVAALATVPPMLRAPALILAPCLGRWGIVLATCAFPYARPEGMGRQFKDSIRFSHVAVAALVALVTAGSLAGAGGVLVWLGVSAVVVAAGRIIAGRLGGLSGDVYGAICESVEAGVLIAFGLRLGNVLG